MLFRLGLGLGMGWLRRGLLLFFGSLPLLVEMSFRGGRRIWLVGVEHIHGEPREVAEISFRECSGEGRIRRAAKRSVAIGNKVGIDFVSDDVVDSRRVQLRARQDMPQFVGRELPRLHDEGSCGIVDNLEGGRG